MIGHAASELDELWRPGFGQRVRELVWADDRRHHGGGLLRCGIGANASGIVGVPLAVSLLSVGMLGWLMRRILLGTGCAAGSGIGTAGAVTAAIAGLRHAEVRR